MNCAAAALDAEHEFQFDARGNQLLFVAVGRVEQVPSTCRRWTYLHQWRRCVHPGQFQLHRLHDRADEQEHRGEPRSAVQGRTPATNNITAPTSGTYKGIAIYQDRRAGLATDCNKMNGNSVGDHGRPLLPQPGARVQRHGDHGATCTMFVARRITFTGNSATTNKFKKLATAPPTGSLERQPTRMVRLVG